MGMIKVITERRGCDYCQETFEADEQFFRVRSIDVLEGECIDDVCIRCISVYLEDKGRDEDGKVFTVTNCIMGDDNG